MMRVERKTGRRALPVLIALTLALIWGHSLLGREASAEESGFVTRLIAPLLEIFVGRGNVTVHMVRKLAHFSEFTILGLELCLYFVRKKVSWKSGFLLSVAHGLFAAFLDETIQIFSGRGPAISDVWIDLAGVVTGSLFVLLVLFLKNRTGRSGQNGSLPR